MTFTTLGSAAEAVIASHTRRREDMSQITKFEPRQSLSVGGKVSAIVPQSMDEAFRLAQAICAAGMAPRGMDTPEKAMIAIMRGLEVGLTPMMALDKIAIVNGRPVIWGDGAIGLVRGSGLCDYVKEYIEGDGDNRVAVCAAKRKGEADPIERRFSVADAKKASLWGKSGPWQQFPERMLQMRARAFALRDLFADVLGGLYLKEEIEEEPRQPQRQPDPQSDVIDGDFNQIEHRPETITDKQRAELERLIAETESDTVAFCRYIKVEQLSELHADDFEAAQKILKEKAARLAAAKEEPTDA
jgi:RecT family